LLSGFAACSASDGGVDEVLDVPGESQGAPEESSQVTVVPSGEASTKLGVARWEVSAAEVYGLDGSGEVLAEFRNTDRGLESVLPEAGVLGVGGSGLPELAQRYYEAFSADAQSVLPAGADPSASVVPSGLVFVDCFGSLATCFDARDAIFEQTRVFCVCQPPDLDQFCGSSLVDLECNL